MKGVVGMISENKVPEPLEKGILRSKNNVFTFKDATIRHDSTDLPLTHFIPKEIGVTVEKLLEMGYEHDCYGQEITNDNQIIELKVQDVVISDNCADYLVDVAHYVDDELKRFYKMDTFYNVKSREDLIGHLIAGLAPHTSAGVLGRIVGFTKALGCYAHPYFHSAKRRNCDSVAHHQRVNDCGCRATPSNHKFAFRNGHVASSAGVALDNHFVGAGTLKCLALGKACHKFGAVVGLVGATIISIGIDYYFVIAFT